MFWYSGADFLFNDLELCFNYSYSYITKRPTHNLIESEFVLSLTQTSIIKQFNLIHITVISFPYAKIYIYLALYHTTYRKAWFSRIFRYAF